jgi:hypothetical protein
MFLSLSDSFFLLQKSVAVWIRKCSLGASCVCAWPFHTFLPLQLLFTCTDTVTLYVCVIPNEVDHAVIFACKTYVHTGVCIHPHLMVTLASVCNVL